MYIDPELLQQKRSNPERIVQVVVGCPVCDDSLIKAIEGAGVTITSTEQSQLGLLVGRICLADLDKLERVHGVDSVEPDSLQQALNL